MTQICLPQRKGLQECTRELGGQHQSTALGRLGEEVGWKRRAAPEIHSFSRHQGGSEEPLVLSDRGETIEMVKMVKVKMTVTAGGGGR